MLDQIFDINKFNIYSDDEYYYFFRALNLADTKDLDDGIILDKNGNIKRIRTNLDRYEGEPKYSKDSEISLDEMVNHIKMHQRKDTNCISLSTNANVSLIYGRGNYKNKYAIIKIPKSKINVTTFNAGLYMLEEINKEIDKKVELYGIDEMQRYLFDFINNAATPERLEEIKKMLPKQYNPNSELFEGGLEINTTYSKQLNALDKTQNFEKDKIVLKMDILNRRIINNMSNTFLIQTIGNAFSSLEFIHYREIKQEELIEITPQQMDILGLVQQVPNDVENIDKIKKIVISKLKELKTSSFNYDNYDLDDESFSMDKMYEMTSGKEDYKTTKYLYKTLFYLAKSKLRNENSVKALKKLLGNDSKYNEFYSYIDNNAYGIEPEICTRLSQDYIEISESVCLDVTNNNRILLDIINKLNYEELVDILNNPDEKIKNLLSDNELLDDMVVSKEDWYANSIIDSLDFESLGVKEKLSDLQRKDIIIALKENNFLETYYELKRQGVSDKNISKVLFTNLIKNKNTINLKDSFTLEELEWFIGYNRVKGLGLNLRNYQRTADENIDRVFEEKQFTSVILPTGAGKSYIALAQLYKHREQKCLYVAPNVEILNQLKNIIRKTYRPEEHLSESIDDTISRIFPNLILTTYQNLKSQENNSLKEEFKDNYGFIVFDELHRTGASEWMKQVNELLDNQNEQVRILGITATPERDMDLKNMADYWAQRYGYTDNEILGNKHLTYNLDIVDAIKLGIITNPKVINCEYSLISDGTMDNLRLSIENIKEENIKKEILEKYEKLRRNVENSNGIEQIIHENVKDGSKHIVFLPVTKNNQGEYEDEDGNKIDKSKAEEIIEKYQLLMRQYIFSYDYLNKEDNKIKELYIKIKDNKGLSLEERFYLEKEKKNILLLSKIDIPSKSNVLNTDTNLIAETIINYMNWENIEYKTQLYWLRNLTNDRVEDYSMLGSYTDNKNQKNLASFNDSKNNKVKLMFVMNKLNEGVHIEDVNGIIWLRPLDTNSRILYLQQLGRCIKSLEPGKEIEDKDIPLVIDLVNNTLKVKLDKGISPHERILNKMRFLEEWIESNGRYPVSESEDEDERRYFNILVDIKNKYEKYIEDDSLIHDEDVKNRLLIEEIIKASSNIDLWNQDLPKKVYVERKKYDREDALDLLFEISALSRDFIELNNEVEKNLESFEYYYSLLVKLKEQGLPTNLSSIDKLRINSDSSIEIVKKIFKRTDRGQVFINQEEYLNNDLIGLGSWLYSNQKKFTEEQKNRLRKIGYLLQEDKNKFDDEFEYYYGLLLKLKEQGENTNLTGQDKIRINEDSSMEVVKKNLKTVDGVQVFINREEYYSNDLIGIGYWLYSNQKKFTEEQIQRLRDIGYILKGEEDTFETYYEYLIKLKEQGENTNLTGQDKIRINEDGTLSVVKKLTKMISGRQICINREEYYSNDLIGIGYWFLHNQEKFTEEQKQKLRDVGYVLKEDKETFSDKFETYYGYLVRLKEQGENTNLSHSDKLRINEDGTITIVKKITKMIDGKQIDINQEEYFDNNLIVLGSWLYSNQEKFTEEQKQRLRDIGYVLKGEEKDKFETYYGYLVRLKEQGDNTNLVYSDRIRINENGTIDIIKEKKKRIGNTVVIINQDEIYSENLIKIGYWLNKNQKNFTEEQKKQLRDVGYVLQGEEGDFDLYFSYLEKIKEQNINVNLTHSDKIRINDDGSISILKKHLKSVDGKKTKVYDDGYFDDDSFRLGYWFIANQGKFNSVQKQRLRDIGYILKEDKETFSDKFETYYGYLVRLKEQGENTNLAGQDKIRINEDSSMEVVKKNLKTVDGVQVFINREEYYSNDLIGIGHWLYSNQEKFTEEQKQRLRDIGYVLKEDKIDKRQDLLELKEELLASKENTDGVLIGVDYQGEQANIETGEIPLNNSHKL